MSQTVFLYSNNRNENDNNLFLLLYSTCSPYNPKIKLYLVHLFSMQASNKEVQNVCLQFHKVGGGITRKYVYPSKLKFVHCIYLKWHFRFVFCIYHHYLWYRFFVSLHQECSETVNIFFTEGVVQWQLKYFVFQNITFIELTWLQI